MAVPLGSDGPDIRWEGRWRRLGGCGWFKPGTGGKVGGVWCAQAPTEIQTLVSMGNTSGRVLYPLVLRDLRVFTHLSLTLNLRCYPHFPYKKTEAQGCQLGRVHKGGLETGFWAPDWGLNWWLFVYLISQQIPALWNFFFFFWDSVPKKKKSLKIIMVCNLSSL